MSTKTIKVPVGKTVSWYVSEEGYVPQRGSYIMGNATHSLNISLQTHQEAPLTMVFSGVAGTLSNIDTTKNVQYRVNDGAWTAAGSSIDVHPGDIIQFKGEYDRFDENTCWTLSNGVIIDKVCGNIGSVLDPVNYATMTTYSSTYALSYFFYGMRYGLIDAGNLVLPATTLTQRCYDSMFGGCGLLTKAPELPAMNLALYCYHNMFNNCDSLTVAPELPATTLAGYCYSNMFAYCDGLTKAPDLIAETLATGCYNYMFRDCSHLNYIKCMSHSSMILGAQYTNNWVNGVADTGTFVSYVHNTTWRTGISGIPTGWVNQTIGDQHTITIDPTPADATVVMNGVEQSSIYDWYGNSYTWSVSKTGYVTQSGSGVIRGDATIPVTLVLEKHTFNVVPTPGDATVIINGEERTSITADYGTTISWSVSKAGYVTQSGTTTLTEDSSISVSLVLQQYTFTIVPTPNDATVTINGVQRTSFTADYGTAITWEVSKNHYVTQSGSTTLTADTSLPITLALEQHTFTITPTPGDATVIINGQERTSATVDYGTSISWSVSKNHYVSQSGSYTMGDNDYTLPVTLSLEQHTFTITPTPVDAVVTINGQQRSTITAAYGTTISWSVGKTGYVTQSNTFTLEGDSTLPVTLVLEKHTFSINATPSDAAVVINGVERSSFVADYGTSITWSVTREGYTGQTGSYTLTQDHTENVSLIINQYTFTISTDASNTVVINGVERSSITADYGTEITWSVSKEHCVTQSNTFTLRRDETLAVALSLEQFTVTINPTPVDAVVTINGQVRSSLIADYGATVSWNVSKRGCTPQSGVIDSLVEDVTLNIVLYVWDEIPLTFDVITDGTIVWKSQNMRADVSQFDRPISYKLNDGDWTVIHSDMGGTTINVRVGDQVSFRNGYNYSQFYSNDYDPLINGTTYCHFTGTALFKAYGNIMSMVRSDFVEHKTDMINRSLAYIFMGSNVVDISNLWFTADVLPNLAYAFLFKNCNYLTTIREDMIYGHITSTSCFESMFEGCTSLTRAPSLGLDDFFSPLAESCCKRMFYGCTSLVHAPTLNATRLGVYCYEGMFSGCTSLVNAPALPSTTLANGCYSAMFSGCTSLTTAPALPSTTLAGGCYREMFYRCTGLVAAPALPATELTTACYFNMFGVCTSLVNAPALPATTLAQQCYYLMFQACDSLETAPDLPATTLAYQCYQLMFFNCDNLKYVKCLAEGITGDDYANYTSWWMSDVPPGGTFVKSPNATWISGNTGIPDGWTVIDAT